MTIASCIAMLNHVGLTTTFVAWLAWSAKGTMLLFIAWLATIALRRGAAAVRHLVWASALAGMLLLPVFARIVPTIHIGWLSEVLSTVSMSRESPVVATSPAPVSEASVTATTAPTPVRVAAPPSIRELAFNVPKMPTERISLGLLVAIAWAAGVSLLLLRALLGVVQLSLWARRANGVDDAEWLSLTQRLAREMQIGRPVTLLQSDRACVPMTWGVVYPRVLLPADADSWLRGRRTVVLLHELAHIKRLDTLTQLIAQVSTAVFWFHPGVWFAAREMRREREHACDDFVLDAGARASDYAHSLLQIARPLVSGAPAAAALAMARKSELEGRLLAILDPRIDRRPASRVRMTVASIGLVALAVPLAAVSPSRVAPHRAPHSASPANSATAMPISNSATPMAATAVTFRPPVAATEGPSWARLTAFARTTTKRPPDVETLIAVTRAAAKMTSDHEKAEVLLSVARHYVADNALRSAYFDAVLSMHNDFDRTRALEPVLMKDTLPASASPQLVRIAEAMSSDNGRGSLVLRLADSRPAMSPSMRSALISVAAGLRSDYERGRCIAAIARQRNLSSDEAKRLIAIAKSMSSSTDKANALLTIVGSRSLDTPELRRAYLDAAETITSPFDYRRAVVRVIE